MKRICNNTLKFPITPLINEHSIPTSVPYVTSNDIIIPNPSFTTSSTIPSTSATNTSNVSYVTFNNIIIPNSSSTISLAMPSASAANTSNQGSSVTNVHEAFSEQQKLRTIITLYLFVKEVLAKDLNTTIPSKRPNFSVLKELSYIFTANPYIGEDLVVLYLFRHCLPKVTCTRGELFTIAQSMEPNLYTKIFLESKSEKCDLRAFVETHISGNLSQISDVIQQIQMNSEDPKLHAAYSITNNKYADCALYIPNCTLVRDIKCGNNMQYVRDALIGRICYTENGQVCNAINNALSIKNVQEKRSFWFKSSNLEKPEDTGNYLLNRLSHHDIIEPNPILAHRNFQDELIRRCESDSALKNSASFYCTKNVKEYTQLSPNFIKKIGPCVTKQAFNTKGDTQNLVFKTMEVVAEEHPELIPIIKGNIGILSAAGIDLPYDLLI